MLPLRLASGFSVFGPWVEREASRFVWLLGYEGDIRAANEGTTRPAERRAMAGSARLDRRSAARSG